MTQSPRTTVLDALISALRAAASHTPGAEVPPCAVLWTDPGRAWISAIPLIKQRMPEVFVFGEYAPEERTGPAVWLRCVVARCVKESPGSDVTPVLYLPGVSRQQLREVEECPDELAPLVELQFRGSVWTHSNGRDWTPTSFLSSDRGGLGLAVAPDGDTREALDRALIRLLDEDIEELKGQSIDADYLNRLLTPDLPSRIIRWMNDPATDRARQPEAEWKAFRQRCTADFGFDPQSDGVLRAGELLAAQQDEWVAVWERFTHNPSRYGGIVDLLDRITPADAFKQDASVYPIVNEGLEGMLAEELRALASLPLDKAVAKVIELETLHAVRRSYVWRELGSSPFACALEHLAALARAVSTPLGGSSATDLAERYCGEGWCVDAAAMHALACCRDAEHAEPIRKAVRALYAQWLDQAARTMQRLVKIDPALCRPPQSGVEVAPGRAILFADGLRMDLARGIEGALISDEGARVALSWEWSPAPTVTATAKPLRAPVAHLLKGDPQTDTFAATIAESGQSLTPERFRKLLQGINVQWLAELETGDPSGCAWTEVGSIDKRGHEQDGKLAQVAEDTVEEISSRIRSMLKAGWREIIVVTDHGWLFMPGGLDKVDLPRFLTETRWGRCAAMKDGVATEMPTAPWYWNPVVCVASPSGAGAFRAGLEYAHGGISPQEMVTPRMTVTRTISTVSARITTAKWIGLRCRVTVEGSGEGCSVDVRRRATDGQSSCVEGGAARGVSSDGTASLPVPDDTLQGTAAIVVILSGDGKIVHQMSTIIGVNA